MQQDISDPVQGRLPRKSGMHGCQTGFTSALGLDLPSLRDRQVTEQIFDFSLHSPWRSSFSHLCIPRACQPDRRAHRL